MASPTQVSPPDYEINFNDSDEDEAPLLSSPADNFLHAQENQFASALSGSPPLVKLNSWDLLHVPEWDKETPKSHCVLRIQRDITTLYSNPPPGIMLVSNENDIMRLDALIVGPEDTPYENGFFHFKLRMPPNYPLQPPRVRFMTTGGGQVRFNPNLYKDGKVCLSILGTWAGPGWSPAQTLTSVLLSIQSLMCPKPYHNEPGFEEREARVRGSAQHLRERVSTASADYNKCIEHETLRVAVCELMEKRAELPAKIRSYLISEFPGLYENFISFAKEKLPLDGEPFNDPHKGNKGRFRYADIMKRLNKIRDTLLATEDESSGDESDLGEDVEL